MKIGDGVTPWASLGYSGDTTSLDWASITGLPTSFPPSPHGHLANEITEDANNRFVSDSEKSDWNNKLDDSSLINCGTW